MENYLEEYFEIVNQGLCSTAATDGTGQAIDKDQAMELWIDKCEETKRKRGIFFLAGNGASATMAEHLSHDCFQNADFLTETVSETSHITAISNDLSYEEVFAYRIRKMLGKDDMLITISASGNSPNIVKAVEEAKKLGVYVVTLSGKSEDNRSRKLGDLNFYVPLDTYGLVESAHAVILHCWLDMYMDKYLGGKH